MTKGLDFATAHNPRTFLFTEKSFLKGLITTYRRLFVCL